MTLAHPWTDLRKAPRGGPSGRQNPHVQPSRFLRWAPTAALLLAGVAVIAAPVSLLLYLSQRDHPGVHYLFGDYTAGLLYPVVGAYLLRRRPDNRVGWVFAATSVVGINGLAGQYAVAAVQVHSWPLGHLAAWVSAWAWAPELAVPALLPLLFPDGTLRSPRWRPVAATAIVSLSVATVGVAFTRHPIDAGDHVWNPWVLPHSEWLRGLSGLAIMVTFLCSVMGLVSLVLRTRRATGPERAQLQWLMLSVVVMVGLAALALPLHGTSSEVLWALAMATIPVGVVVAVVRHQMLDIELVLNRTIAYALLTGVVIVSYVGTVSALGEVAAQRAGIAAVAAVTLLIAAARDRVQRAVDRALFGDRRDPYAVVDRLGQRLDAARGPVDALDQLAGELRTALRLPYVGIVPVASSVPPVAVGTEVAGTLDVPIAVHGAQLGVLQVGHRHRGERLRPEEHSVLHDTARRAGGLLQAAALVADLEQSRERLVVAREEERRRLRHDLHDGVGPQLAGLALQLDLLARRLGHDDDATTRVQLLRDRLRDTVVEVRRVVDDLRPPALDDVGLVEAVRQQVSAYAVVPAGSSGPAALVTVTAGPLPPLSAAVEVAAYRVVTEAVANAVRHGRPSRCGVQMTVEGGALVAVVADDGVGIADGAAAGVGMTSMRERVAELGGELDVRSNETGTTVRARLPLEQS